MEELVNFIPCLDIAVYIPLLSLNWNGSGCFQRWLALPLTGFLLRTSGTQKLLWTLQKL